MGPTALNCVSHSWEVQGRGSDNAQECPRVGDGLIAAMVAEPGQVLLCQEQLLSMCLSGHRACAYFMRTDARGPSGREAWCGVLGPVVQGDWGSEENSARGGR